MASLHLLDGRLIRAGGHCTDLSFDLGQHFSFFNSKLRPNQTQYLLPLFVSRSAALTELETQSLKEWNHALNDLENKDAKIFRPQGGFLPFARSRKGSSFVRLRPPKWFKSINCKVMSQLTQMRTNHAPTGEYFRRDAWEYQDNPPPPHFSTSRANTWTTALLSSKHENASSSSHAHYLKTPGTGSTTKSQASSRQEVR